MNSTNTISSSRWERIKADFMRRVKATKTTRWWRFGIVAALFIAWVVWLGNWWVILLLPLLFDIYITGYIPFTWWKNSKNKAFVMVMSWVDAIIYALILVYFVFTFIGQNYQIPSSSLEKTLLTGDYLWVNKMAYGPRVPMTPIHFPLVQNTFPVLNTKSYIEWPQWKYHRLAGFGNVEAGDIVVFNFPAGDTVALKQQNPDYYTLKKYIGDGAFYRYANGMTVYNNEPLARHYEELLATDSVAAYAFRDDVGTIIIQQQPDYFGEVIYRPVDRRENYVKRCVGLPGDKFEIRDGAIYINDKPQPWPEEAQFNYIFQTNRPLSDMDWEEQNVAVDDRRKTDTDAFTLAQLAENGFKTDYQSLVTTYCVPLTNAMVKQLENSGLISKIMRQPAPTGEYLFPDFISRDWTRADYGPVYIPKKGETVKITPENWPMYERVIRNYEHHTDSYVKDGVVYIDGKPADGYTFAMDYYFMMGDNRDNSLDSRYWGFVPEDHIVGKPMRVLISFDKDKGIFNGGIRWNRIFKNANPGF